jgi:hypothetical protein
MSYYVRELLDLPLSWQYHIRIYLRTQCEPSGPPEMTQARAAHQRPQSTPTFPLTRTPATEHGQRRPSSRRRPAHTTKRLRPDFGPRGEHYVNRLSHFAQGLREGWAKRHRFAPPTNDPNLHPLSPSRERQLQSAGRRAM